MLKSTARLQLSLAAMAMLASQAGVPTEFPELPSREPRPAGYGVHLSKAERRGKSVEELQALRAERLTHA